MDDDVWSPSEITQLRNIVLELLDKKCDSNLYVMADPEIFRSFVNKCTRVFKTRSKEDISSKIYEEFDLSSLSVKKGKWSKKEEEIIKNKAREYVTEHEKSIEEILDSNNEERRKFYIFIAQDLQRPLRSVRKKINRLLNPKNHLGQYSEKELHALVLLEKKYKKSDTKWKDIGDKMGRSADSVRDRYVKAGKHYKNDKIPWSLDEELALLQAVNRYNTDWDKVSEAVGTKNRYKCLRKYYSIKSRTNYSSKGHKNFEDVKIDIVRILNKLDRNYLSDIDWYDVSRQVPNCSASYLKSVFRQMVAKYVPFSNDYSLQEIIDILMRKLGQVKSNKQLEKSAEPPDLEHVFIDIKEKCMETKCDVDNGSMEDSENDSCLWCIKQEVIDIN